MIISMEDRKEFKMGEYARCNQMIREHKGQIEELKQELAMAEGDKRESILEQIYDLQIGIGEIEGALMEMAEIDGLEDRCEAFD